ncbi:MAG: hypothetical protein FJ271_11585 [Planctomycetes bacterium]|nr:hypothetical protein [Planctomycetota bacterium]
MTPNRILAALVTGCLWLANQGMAKPPDLPIDLTVRCQETGAPVDARSGVPEECFPCPDACLAVGGCVGWATVQALLGQFGSVQAEQLTVTPKVVRRKKTIVPAVSHEEQDARELEELHQRSHQLRLQSRSAPANSSEQAEAAWRERMARQLYRIAEGCLRKGDHEMAYSCYCEVELLVPDSALGERARQHMDQCRRQMNGAEEAESTEDQEELKQGDKFDIE